MRTLDIIDKIIDVIQKYHKCINLNIHIRFYIRDKLFSTFIIKKFFNYKYTYKDVSFGDNLRFLLDNNLHLDYFEYTSDKIYIGKIECHGHGDFYGVDTLIINFNRGDI